ncbi:MAG: hypothetical protein ABUL58_04635 [Steroidobacter sp.]
MIAQIMDKHFRNKILVLSVAAICLVAFLYFNETSMRGAGPLTNGADALRTSMTFNDKSTEALPDSVPTLTLPQSPTITVLKESQSEIQRRGWVAMQGAEAPFKISSQARDQMTVDTSSADLGNVKYGDRISFQLPDGSEAVAHVENTWTESNGDQVWSGHIEDVAGADYRIVVTQGSSATFASINTSKGSYSLESINGRGVVYKNPEMGDVAPRGTTDYLMPES